MGAFKDQLASDIKNVFLSLDEFAEEYLIEGKSVPISMDSDTLKEMKADLGLAESSLLIYAAVEDLPPRRAAGQVLNINRREYTIDDWSVNLGMAAIILSQPKKM